jgi:hypothetical protein
VRWFVFRFDPDCAISLEYGHKVQTHLRLLREFARFLKERSLD